MLTYPTPIVKFPDTMPGTQIYIKRDDLNGLLVSGNKARKMVYLVADARRRGCNVLVTCGGIQSNHCRTVAAFAQQFGFECHLFLRGRPCKIFTGNFLIDHLLGTKVGYVTEKQYSQIDSVMEKHAEKLKKSGLRCYIIPEGGSNAIGCLGYRDCMLEMKECIQRNQIEAVYCAVGSGGTYAGLLLGKKSLKQTSVFMELLFVKLQNFSKTKS